MPAPIAASARSSMKRVRATADVRAPGQRRSMYPRSRSPTPGRAPSMTTACMLQRAEERHVLGGPTRFALAHAGSIVRRLVVPDLDQVLAGIEEVDGLSGSARARLVAGSPHVSHGVERVAIWKPRVDDPAEDVVELRPGHREGEMVAARGAPRCEL